MSIQNLPFDCRLAVSNEDYNDACTLRARAYGHHLPNVNASYGKPDDIDRQSSTALLLCRDKLTRKAVGSARIQSTTRGSSLLIEKCVSLPEAIRQDGRAEITKLAVPPGAHALVRLIIWKAGYLYCLANQTRWLLIGARSDALVRQYGKLGTVNLYPDGRSIPLPYADGIPHQILLFDVIAAERRWFESNHPMFDFMFNIVHPDLALFADPTKKSMDAAIAA